MEAYQQRVVDELAALNDKLGRLSVFLISANFGRLPEDEQLRMSRQHRVMNEYAHILQDRIDHFPK